MNDERSTPVTGAVLVVGGGIAGIQSALDLAESGYRVHLVESSPAIGGVMAQHDKTFPTNDCSMCILSPKVVECARHINIELHTLAEVEAISGEAGSFTVTLRNKARLVDPARCISCGACSKVCPVEVPSEYDERQSMRKAIYRPYPQAVPNTFAIDKRGTAPCKAACPAGTSVQGFIALIAQGRLAQALELARRSNPFTGVCGYICDHPCESVCSRQLYDGQPLAIAPLERYLSDWAVERGDPSLKAPPVTRSQRVAIAGGGAAGLTAAADLARLGYAVEVYEREPEAGGMMRYGVPAFRLPREVLDNEIRRISSLGVTITTNAPVDDAAALLADHQALLWASDVPTEPRSEVSGEDLPGVHTALAWLRALNSGQQEPLAGAVVVAGRGAAALDAARAVRRLGAEVTLVLPHSLAALPPWWKLEQATAEGIQVILEHTLVAIQGESAVTGVCIKPSAEPGAASLELPASTVILAPDPIATAAPQLHDAGFFAVASAGNVVDAVAAGHHAAERIHAYLNGEEIQLVPRIDPDFIALLDRSLIAEEAAQGRHHHRARTEPDEHAATMALVELGLAAEEACSEAQRCLNCGICAECYRCVDVCKSKAVDHSLQPNTTELQVGAVILTTGSQVFDARTKHELGYGRYPDVITSIEFERLLSSSGPCGGHLVRPSDHQEPRRIAFLQCVGSRDAQCGNAHCSSVCCMSAIKEAVIAQEHAKGAETSIFFMEMRAFGKDFDKYYERARDEYGVRFLRSRSAKVERNAVGELEVVYATEEDRLVRESFDMVVLSVGLEPSQGTRDLVAKLGLRSGESGFIKVGPFAPQRTSRAGVFVGGTASGPKDIPETVVQASAAAAEAGALLASARGSLATTKTFAPETNVVGVAPRVGVFVCHCGVNIAATVDVEAVREYARGLPFVAYAGRSLFACSQDAQESLKDLVIKHRLNRIVVASCSPRTHEALFQETIREVGLNPYLIEIANIRNQCSWVHADLPAEATNKAKDLVRVAVSRVVDARPLYGQTLPVTRSALVLGGGLTGMSAALLMSAQGYPVHLVEQEAVLGGNARELLKTLEGNDVPSLLADLERRIAKDANIQVHLNRRLARVEGFVGNFRSTLEDPQACGEVFEHGVIIVATGAQERRTRSYLYGQHAGVLTQRELETQLTDGRFALGDGYSRVVMIQCVESRTREHPYCSRVCCSQALKNAITLKRRYPDCEVVIVYRDIRSYGLRERYYAEARRLGVLFVHYELEPDAEGRGGLPAVNDVNGQLVVSVYDPVSQQLLELPAAHVVLSVGIAPRPEAGRLASMLKVPLNAEEFFLEAHMKLRPVEFATEGIYVAGLGHGPKFIDESLSQAAAAVSRACTVLSKDELHASGVIAHVNQASCVACGDCVAICPYGAISIVNKEVGRRVFKDCAEVNTALCKGCGACTSCRSGCITLDGLDDQQIMAQITALAAS